MMLRLLALLPLLFGAEGARVKLKKHDQLVSLESEVKDEDKRPSVSESFIAKGMMNVETKMPMMGAMHISGSFTQYFDLAGNRNRMDSSDNQILELYDVRKKYTIQGGKCTEEDLKQEMAPSTPPPPAKRCGGNDVDQDWCFDFEVAMMGMSTSYSEKSSIHVAIEEGKQVAQLQTKHSEMKSSMGGGGSGGGNGGFDFGGMGGGMGGMGDGMGGDMGGGIAITTTLKYASVTDHDFDVNDVIFQVPNSCRPPPPPPPTFEVNGFVSDAVTGRPIEGAKVAIEGHEATTDKNGKYTIKEIEKGNHDVTLTMDGYSVDHFNIDVQRNIVAGTVGNAALSPTLVPGSFRIVLNWDRNPADLDSHLSTPGCEVAFNHKICTSTGVSASLDRDATKGYGPETITIKKHNEGQTSTHKVFIYSGNGGFPASHARVVLYNSNGRADTMEVSTSDASKRWWTTWKFQGGNFEKVDSIA